MRRGLGRIKDDDDDDEEEDTFTTTMTTSLMMMMMMIRMIIMNVRTTRKRRIKLDTMSSLILMIFYMLQLMLIYGGDQGVDGCLLLYNAWLPLSLTERSRKADIVLTARVRHTYKHHHDEFESSSDDQLTYPAEFSVLSILKGESIVDLIKPDAVERNGAVVDDGGSGGGRHHHHHHHHQHNQLTKIYNISNFGAKSMCYSNVVTGQSYILFLTTGTDGRLTARYDDIFGAAAEMTSSNLELVLKGVGSGYWSDWSTCSATCEGGHQERKRVCSLSQKCQGIQREKRKCNTFKCHGIRDLLKIFNFVKHGRRGVRPLTDRQGAFRVDRSSHLRLPTYTLFPYSEYFPATFSLLATVRASEKGGGNFLGITDEKGRRRLALRLGTSIEFTILNANAYQTPSKQKPAYYRLNATVADFQWHTVAISVQKSSIQFYVDCRLHSSFSLIRTYAGRDIAVASILTIGYLPNTIKDLNFEGDVEQLLIVADTNAAEDHCGQATKIVDVEAEALVMDESYGELDDSSGDGMSPVDGSGEMPFEVEWSEWSSCSVTCGEGVRKRTSYCLDNGRNLEECIDSLRERMETEPCHLRSCPFLSAGKETVYKPALSSKPTRNITTTTRKPTIQKQQRCADLCQNGGSCVSKDKCLCLDGYYGQHCEHVSCLGCLNGGRCLKPNICTCQDGFNGTRCQDAVCKVSCENGGRCVGPDRCLCSYGYSPPTCTPICNPPCYNGGVCLTPSRCKCAKGYTGNSCQTALCQDGCKNSGRCIAPDKCVCSSGYGGNDCSTPICVPSCQNGGLCIKPYTCLCKVGFSGSYCEKFTCNPECSNGGTCIAANKCSCPTNYIGNQCQTVVCNAKCLNGGKCVALTKCSCPTGYSGDKCEKKKCKKYQSVNEPYQRSYKKKVMKSSKESCGQWSWKSCSKSKIEYEIVNRTFYRTTYKCLD